MKTVELNQKETLIKKFSEILNEHITEPDDVRAVINSWMEHAEFMTEISMWNRTWISSLRTMEELILKSGDKELISRFTTIADSFIEGMVLGHQYNRASQLMFAMQNEINQIL